MFLVFGQSIFYRYLSHRNRQFPPDIKIKNYKIRIGLTKLTLILWFIFYYSWKNVCNMKLFMVFKIGWEPVLIGFEVILEKLCSTTIINSFPSFLPICPCNHLSTLFFVLTFLLKKFWPNYLKTIPRMVS